jgi:hypothetical protein
MEDGCMCMMCDGSSYEEAIGEVFRLVDALGWALVPIGDDDGGGWMYTVGLASRGHPELVMAGVDLDAAAATLDALASSVFDGVLLDECATAPTPGCDDDGPCTVGLVDVHQSHLDRGLITIAELRVAAVDPDAPPPRARQVVLPEAHLCRCHRHAQPRLDRPGATLGAGLDRTARRGRRRGRH